MTSMTEEGTVLLRLHKVLATVFPPKKREYVQINIIDPNPIARGPWLSEIYSCMIENRETGETMFIVAKVVPLSEYIAKYGNVYRNEVHFYSVIFPNLKEFQKRKRVGNPFVNIPRYFGERLTTREEFLALEDVRKDGYELFDKTRCLTSQHLNMIFQTYARFHALSFVYKYEHPEDFSRMTSGLVDITQMAYKQTPIRFIDEAYRTAINAFNLETEADIIEKLNKIENVKDTLTKVQKYHGNYSCLIHGDCWTINNMLFKYKITTPCSNIKNKIKHLSRVCSDKVYIGATQSVLFDQKNQKMMEDVPSHDRLNEILSTMASPIKRENFVLTLDPNQVRTNGFLSEFYTGTSLNKDTGETTHIAIKVVPSNVIMNSYEQVYKNEVNFYSIIFPELDKYQRKKRVKTLFRNIPRYLRGHLLEKRECLLLEDIRRAGYEFPDRCLTSEQLEMSLKTYANFHALSFVYKHDFPQKFNDMTSELIDVMKYMNTKGVGKSIEAAFGAAIEAFDLQQESDIVNRLKKVEDVRNILAHARNTHGEYTCLIHGDCWIYNNMLFKHKKSGELENVKLIDFQLVFVSTPVLDLSYFFYSGAEKADMDKLDYYLELYYDSFSSFVTELGGNPQEIYPFEALKEEWMKYSLSGLIIGIGMWVGKLLDKNELFSLVDRQGLPREKYFELWNAKLSEVRKGNTFRQRARDICLHAVEYGIL